MSERRYLFISTPRLDELYGQSTEGRGRLTGVDATFLGVGGGFQRASPDARAALYREIEHVLLYLKDNQRLGTPDDPLEYFWGRVSMFIVPFDQVRPAVLYLTGRTERTVVALAGPLKHMVGLDPGDAKSTEGARFVHSEQEVAAVVAEAQRGDDEQQERCAPASPQPDTERWERNIVETYQRLTYYPQNFEEREVEMLAWRDRFSEVRDVAGALADPMSVLLGRPIFIAY
jgi:hypothetical protein